MRWPGPPVSVVPVPDNEILWWTGTERCLKLILNIFKNILFQAKMGEHVAKWEGGLKGHWHWYLKGLLWPLILKYDFNDPTLTRVQEKPKYPSNFRVRVLIHHSRKVICSEFLSWMVLADLVWWWLLLCCVWCEGEWGLMRISEEACGWEVPLPPPPPRRGSPLLLRGTMVSRVVAVVLPSVVPSARSGH